MKKLLLSILACMAITATNAQLTKGSVFLDGSINYNYSNVENNASSGSSSSYNNLTLSPELTFMINNSVAIGFNVGILNSTDTYHQYIYTISGYTQMTDISKNRLITPSVFIQKFYPISNHLYWSLKTELGYGWGKTTNSSDSQKYTALGLGISPELDYFISKKAGIKANFNGVNYTHLYYSNSDVDKLSIDLNPSSWSFGFFVKL